MNKFTKKMNNKETMESLKMDKYIISYEYFIDWFWRKRTCIS